MIERTANTAHAGEPPRQWVSDLMDGRLSPGDTSLAMDRMDDPELRQSWQVYHLIGDVLRSDDLAFCHGGDTFVERLRIEIGRTQQEPGLSTGPTGVLRPEVMHVPAANDAVFRWKLVAGLASFSAVALLGWSAMSGWGGPGAGGAQLARAPAPENASKVLAVSTPMPPVSADAPVMLRDPRLDALLAAHRQSSGVSALGNASGFLRSATFEGAGR